MNSQDANIIYEPVKNEEHNHLELHSEVFEAGASVSFKSDECVVNRYIFNTSGSVPLEEDFAGAYRFSVVLPIMENRNSSAIRLSDRLGKAFIKIMTAFNIKMIVEQTQFGTEALFVRATPKYLTHNASQPVDRCPGHFFEDDPDNKSHQGAVCRCTNYKLAGHVLRSSNFGATYCFDPITGRHSVLNRLNRYNYDISYSIHCSSSCIKGINRRPLRLVFTLEKRNGVILGQSTLNIKVCANPARDKLRDEAQYDKCWDNKRPTKITKPGESRLAALSRSTLMLDKELQLVRKHMEIISLLTDNLCEKLEDSE